MVRYDTVEVENRLKTPPLRAEQFEYLNYTQNYIILYNMSVYNYFIFITVIHQAHYKYYVKRAFIDSSFVA